MEQLELTQTPILPQVGDWYVLHTRPRQEKILAADLEAMKIGYFLPLMPQARFYGKRKVIVSLPMFPSYIFVRGDRDAAFAADRTRRVAQIIPVTQQAVLDWELRNLAMALSCQAALDPYPYLVEGQLVEVRSGPFRGLQGVIEKRVNPTRLLLQVQMLGRGMSLEVDASLLDRIDLQGF